MFIAALPVELISKICNHLDFQQLVALRLSCRALYKSSLENFAKTFYRKIRFIVTSESLHELEELSKSNGLREHVQELWMIPTVFDGTEEPLGMVSISSKSCRQVNGDELENRYAVHKAMLADNSNLLESEALSVRLRECMDRFKNLQTIGLAHYKTEFLLDPRQQTVPFLGRRQMMSRIDFRFDVYSLGSLTHTNKDSQIRKLNSLAISKLFLALCGSSCRPRKLYTCDSDFCGDIGPGIALPEEQFDSLLSTLKGLEDLHLCVDLNEAAWLKIFTKLAPQLGGLTLSQDHMPAYPAKSYVGNMFHDISFIRLRELHIHELDIYSNCLKSLLLSVKKTLVLLTLQRVTIRSEELRAAENPGSQHSESPGHQENERSIPWMSTNTPYGAGFSSIPPSRRSNTPTFQFTSPASQLPSSGFHPTSPLYEPTSPYVPTSPSYEPTSPYVPTSPSFQPTPPSFSPSPWYTPTVAPPEYGPAPLPVLLASETAWAESAPQFPQHSSTSESSESTTEAYPSAKWLSTYHPYSPPDYTRGSVCPTWETQMAWKRNEEKVTCMSSLLGTLQNELSLETLSLEDIICDDNYYYFKNIDNGTEQSGRVDFDIREASISFKEWISRLSLVAHCPGYRILALKEDEGW
ncbi:uncharacterized protein N7484_000437 [Penicillium longicatenatum]|uniref:uncharacterized protein n=1 Tax=Penicillium longicatenatum TaxID=1561947 RepID=UPI0025482901|nr:uncharacterized protein N7484_000437 [Penicillium longicatenatum]KAJ5661065.1 hypothetical protein N7484_000437 [Penicillium longicatenatum]